MPLFDRQTPLHVRLYQAWIGTAMLAGCIEQRMPALGTSSLTSASLTAAVLFFVGLTGLLALSVWRHTRRFGPIQAKGLVAHLVFALLFGLAVPDVAGESIVIWVAQTIALLVLAAASMISAERWLGPTGQGIAVSPK